MQDVQAHDTKSSVGGAIMVTDRDIINDLYAENAKILRYMYAHFGGHFTDVDCWDDPEYAEMPHLWRAIWNVCKHWWKYHKELKHELAEGKRIMDEALKNRQL